ncbi:hypothetical protein NO932_13175 [Pelagibacterium sp. 26DY04]|uniref:hypothetical protein n=1 Tax=Pelagibacterium sp. 26DY04 TaxID=2967130 RepID=UPI0028149B57|nr:hypothetical protein [Pelagibacterium sp. 26DY04]WMT85873.1 hypothetical protein NO932_13175 [Pelagibacterium sp. 26DY04]
MALTAPFAAAANRASTAVRSVGQSVVLYAAIVLVGLTGAGFLVAALYIWLAQVTSTLAAALLMGAGFLAIAGIALAIAIGRGRKKKRENQRAAANTALLASSVSLATTAIRIVSRVRGPLLLPAIAALAAGWYLSTTGHDDEDE